MRFIRENNLTRSGRIWQRSFYDHIIKDEKTLNKIREYILNNPANWSEDEENTKNNKRDHRTLKSKRCREGDLERLKSDST